MISQETVVRLKPEDVRKALSYWLNDTVFKHPVEVTSLVVDFDDVSKQVFDVTVKPGQKPESEDDDGRFDNIA